MRASASHMVDQPGSRRAVVAASLVLASLTLSGCFGLDTTPKQTGDTEDSSADTGPVTVGSLSVDRTAIDFGSIEPGSSATEAVVLTNGSDSTLRVAAALTGDAVFQISDSDVAMAAGGDSTLTVTFAPSGEMTYGGTIGLALEDGTALDIALTGTGGAGGDTQGDDTGTGVGAISITPGTQDLGTINLGSTSAAYTFTVKNTGSDDVLIDSVHTSDSAFSVTGGTLSVPQVLSSGSSKTVEVMFSPTAERAYTGDLVVDTDLTPSSYSASLTGTGADLCSICAPQINVNTAGGDPYSVTDFFSLYGSTDTRTWTIHNTGDMDLTVTSVVVNNDFISTCGTFAISGFTGPETVAPAAATSFEIAYTTTGSCLELDLSSIDANVVHIRSNDSSEGDYVIVVGGSGLWL